jgi:hypothetical protein
VNAPVPTKAKDLIAGDTASRVDRRHVDEIACANAREVGDGIARERQLAVVSRQ